MKKIFLFLVSINMFLGLIGCGASNQNVVKEKKVIDDQLLYEEYKSRKAQDRLNQELSK
jgi:uncharacterized protein YcfL